MPVVTSASATPPVIACSDWPPPEAAMPWNAFTTPNTVPSRPTNGAVAPVVARIERPRLSSEVRISICRSTARSAELMSPAVMVARSRSSGFTSFNASPSTRATWLFLQRPRELRRELAGLLLRLAQVRPLLHRDRPGDQRHQHHQDDDAPGEKVHGVPQIHQTHTGALLAEWRLTVALDLEVDRNRDQHAHGAAVHPAGPVQRLEHDVLGGLIEAGVRALGHAHGVGLDAAGRIDDRL